MKRPSHTELPRLPVRRLTAMLLIFFCGSFVCATAANAAQDEMAVTVSASPSRETGTVNVDSLDPDQLKTAAEAGSAEAQYQLGMLYGIGSTKLKIRKNRTEATNWLRKAAEQGLFQADLELAKIRMTRYRKAEPVNWSKVIAHWQQEAEAGSHEAQANLGFCYAEGIGIEADGPESVRWCTMAVESDPTDHFPMFTLAKLYRDGKILPADPGLAFMWMKRAADTGYSWAQLRLAEMYAEGVGTDQNFTAAAELAAKAQMAGVGKEAGEAAERFRRLEKRPKATRFEITVAGSPVSVTRIGTGPIGVIFFGHTGVADMNKYLLDNFEWLETLMTGKCTFFLWEYPASPPFDQITTTLASYRDGDHSVRLAFPDIAGKVVSQIQKASGLEEFLVIGNSLGAGIVLWDYSQLVGNKKLKFLLISPTEAFMPRLDEIPTLERTTVLAAKGWKNDDREMRTDIWLRGEEAWDWVAEHRDDTLIDLITASRAGEPEPTRQLPDGKTVTASIPTDFKWGHKTIGNEINSELLGKLIKVKLGFVDPSVLAESPKQR